MNKNKYIFWLVVIILTALIGYGVFYFLNKNTNPVLNTKEAIKLVKKVEDKKSIEAKCSKENDDFHKRICIQRSYREIFEKEINPEICKAIKDEALREECIGTVAVKEAITKGDESKCNYLTNPEEKRYCLEGAIYTKSEKNNDEKICDKLGENLNNLDEFQREDLKFKIENCKERIRMKKMMEEDKRRWEEERKRSEQKEEKKKEDK